MAPMRIPEQVERLLARIRRETRQWIWVESLAMVAVLVSLGIAVTLAIDWLVEPPAWARATLVIAVAVALFWLVATRLVARLSIPLPDHALALAVERHHQELGDSFSTAVGFAKGDWNEADPELVQRTTQLAENLTPRIEPGRLFRRRRLAGVATVGLASIATVAGMGATWPDVATMWTRRVILLDETPWPRRVRFEAEGFRKGGMTVARGSNVNVLVRAKTTRGPIPDLVELRVRGGESLRLFRMGTRGGVTSEGQLFAHVIEGIGEDLTLEVRGGDGRLRDLRIHVVEPPALAGATIQYTLPTYLGGGERSPPFSRDVPVPRGARVTATLTTSKKMATARLVGRFASDEGSEAAAETLLAEITATDSPSTTIAATIPALASDATLSLDLTDIDGIVPSEPFTVSLTSIPDEPPTIALRLFDISGVVTPKARIPIIGTLSDDHGLTQAAIAVARGNDTRQHAISRASGGKPLVEVTADSPEVVPIEPLGLRPGDRLVMNAIAIDNCALGEAPNTTLGDTWTLEVVTPEALQASLEAREIFLRRRLEATIDDLLLARRSLDEANAANPDAFQQGISRLSEATARGIGEVGEIATAFRSIRNEFDANGLLTAELESRVIVQVAGPLAALADSGLGGLAQACRTAATGDADRQLLIATADASISALKAILARLLELESFNEVVEKLRALIHTQEQIRADTLDQQRKRARQALEGL